MAPLWIVGDTRWNATQDLAAARLPSRLMAVDVRVKRVYDPPEPGDGHRLLIDHVWPRGISRERAGLDEWARELAPSDEVRRRFDHVPERFDEFRMRYREELAAHAARLQELRRRARSGPLTIVYAARDREHNNAIVLAELLRDG
jgi:uncharacterized protein YeaO (DUF488 family)